MDVCLKVNATNNPQLIYLFAKATEGNYRNSFYIDSDAIATPCGGKSCGDLLFVPSHNGVPIIFRIEDIAKYSFEEIDRTECIGIIPKSKFIKLYDFWIKNNVNSSSTCPLNYSICAVKKNLL